jgi:hypothetical protein
MLAAKPAEIINEESIRFVLMHVDKEAYLSCLFDSFDYILMSQV